MSWPLCSLTHRRPVAQAGQQFHLAGRVQHRGAALGVGRQLGPTGQRRLDFHKGPQQRLPEHRLFAPSEAEHHLDAGNVLGVDLLRSGHGDDHRAC